MKENKGKNVASGTEVDDVQVQDEPTPLAIQKFTIQTIAGKRKCISSNIDLGSLPRRQGLKKHKSEKIPPSKVSKPLDATVDLDDPVVNLVPSQLSPSVV